MKEGKSQKNFKISIRAKILTGMIACVLIVTLSLIHISEPTRH